MTRVTVSSTGPIQIIGGTTSGAGIASSGYHSSSGSGTTIISTGATVSVSGTSAGSAVGSVTVSSSGGSTAGGFAGSRGSGAATLHIASETLNDAVYSYLQALRALGQTKVNSDEIAGALNISSHAARRALNALGDRGVKIAK